MSATCKEELVRLERNGRVALLIAENPPVNALSWNTRKDLLRAVEAVGADEAISAAVILCEGRTFFAGADINELSGPAPYPTTRVVADVIEASNKPFVAAIHGTAYGGGCEIALGCHFRLCVPSAKLSLPEVKLGLIPGGGGTQRLPRLVGVERALEMIVTGEPVTAEAAFAMGLVDAIAAEEELRAEAIRFAAKLDSVQRGRRTSDRAMTDCTGAVETWLGKIENRWSALVAPRAAAEAISLVGRLPYAQAVERERQLFRELRSGSQSRALRQLFFAQRAAAKSGLLHNGQLTPRGDIVRARLLEARQRAAPSFVPQATLDDLQAALWAPDDNDVIADVAVAEAAEAAAMLEQGLIGSLQEADAVAVRSCGWPGWRGGPVHWCNEHEQD